VALEVRGEIHEVVAGDPASDGPPENGLPDGVVAFTARALGSPLKLFVRVAGRASDGARDAAGRAPASELAWDAVRAEFAAVDAALSRFREDSELTALNRLAGSGGVALVSWRMRTMLAAVHRAACTTDGRFDATVLDALERLGERGATINRDGRISGERDATIGRDGRASGELADLVAPGTPRASLVRIPGLPVDSGGIGKGLALRWAAAAAIASLPEGSGVLLDAGGDIASAGIPPKDGWGIGVEDPIAPPVRSAPLAVYRLRRGGVSTSSVAVRNWVAADGRRVHHLIDPTTREPARTRLISVSVAGPDPAWNEVWSKALFLGGSETIGEESRRRGFAVWWVDDRGRLGMTPEARVRSAWIAEDRVG
jgi:thiamine biosynthesis lipoprotein